MSLDIRTVALFSALLPIVLGMIMVVYWWERRTYGGFGHWVLANFAFGVGYLLISLRGVIPDFLSIVVGNVTIVYGEILVYEGSELFYGRRASSKLNYSILGTYFLLQGYFTYIDPNINIRTALVSFVFTVLFVRTGMSLANCPFPPLIRTARSAAGLSFFSAIFPFIRMIYVLSMEQEIDLLHDPLSSWFGMEVIIAILIWTFYFFLLNTARLEMDLETARLELEEIAYTDHLTGLYNRRHFFEHAEIEIQHAKRFDRKLSFLLLDADDFKAINDTYGHAGGDHALLHIASIAKRVVRSYDLVARFGGDEFIVMLVGADEDQAVYIAERIRMLVEQTAVSLDGRKFMVHLSVGIVTFENQDSSLMGVLSRVDAALYRAKKRGRNRVQVA